MQLIVESITNASAMSFTAFMNTKIQTLKCFKETLKRFALRKYEKSTLMLGSFSPVQSALTQKSTKFSRIVWSTLYLYPIKTAKGHLISEQIREDIDFPKF